MKYFDPQTSSFTYKHVVVLSDVDQFKHMSFANYLKIMFVVFDAFMLQSFDKKFLDVVRFRLISSDIRFKRQTMAGERLIIQLNSTNRLFSECDFLFTFSLETSGEIVSLGRQRYEIQDLSGHKFVEIPLVINQAIASIAVESNALYETNG